MEAGRILQRKKVGFENPIDIFSIVESDDIVLNFQELGNLAGAYIPQIGPCTFSGILVNESLPITRQRYTVAHEYCHHIRNDPVSFDTSDQLFSEQLRAYKRDDRERIAEIFASCLLMPRQLIAKSLSKMGLSIRNTRDQISPMQAYSLSLRLGCSYAATTARLLSLGLISSSLYKELLDYKPIKIKTVLGKEHLESSWNDIWVLSGFDHGTNIYPRQGDVIQVTLIENATTGYKWEVSYNADYLEMTENVPVLSEDMKVGASGVRYFEFVVGQPGRSILEFKYCRPWDIDSIVDRIQVNCLTQEKRHGISPHWLLAG